jgi:hypothetical protein
MATATGTLWQIVRPESLSPYYVRLAAAGSIIAVAIAVLAGWPLWLIVSVGLALWTPVFTMEVAWTKEHFGWLALLYGLSVLQGAHMVEHVVQMVQLHVLHLTGPAARGVFGMLDIEWVHFVWNSLVFVALGLLVWRFPRSPFLWATFAISVWHQVEHSYILSVYLRTGVSGTPGLLAKGGKIGGGLWLKRPDLHFFYNLVETLTLFAAFGLQLRRSAASVRSET